MKLTVRTTFSLQEELDVVKLLCGAFPGKFEELREMFTLMLREHPDLIVIAVENEDARIVSVLFLISGNFISDNRKFSYCNMSYFATELSYRRGDATKLIIKYVIDFVQKEFDFVFGFPRHVMQGYWSRHNFKELTNGNCVNLRLSKSDLPKSLGTRFRYVTEADSRSLERIYINASGSRVIDFERSIQKWNYILRISKCHDTQICILSDSSGEDFGYVVVRRGVTIEAATLLGQGSLLFSQELLNFLCLDELDLSFRGMMPELQTFFRSAVMTFLDPKISSEDLWDFMFFCPEDRLARYFSITEGAYSGQNDSGISMIPDRSPSNFTLLDQY